RFRAFASSGCISSGGGPSATCSPPKVDVMRWSEAGEINISGYDDATGRQLGRRAPYFFSRYGDASSTLPDVVLGNTFLNRIASSVPPPTVIGVARSSGIALGRLPPRRPSAGSR